MNDEETNKIALLAVVTNKDVDEWNNKIQQLNPNEEISLLCKDMLCEEDDPNGIKKKYTNRGSSTKSIKQKLSSTSRTVSKTRRYLSINQKLGEKKN